jgi:hypothetical protein
LGVQAGQAPFCEAEGIGFKYVPAEQVMTDQTEQLNAPASEYDPYGHDVQTNAPASEYDPAEHGAQLA